MKNKNIIDFGLFVYLIHRRTHDVHIHIFWQQQLLQMRCDFDNDIGDAVTSWINGK